MGSPTRRAPVVKRRISHGDLRKKSTQGVCPDGGRLEQNLDRLAALVAKG